MSVIVTTPYRGTTQYVRRVSDSGSFHYTVNRKDAHRFGSTEDAQAAITRRNGHVATWSESAAQVKFDITPEGQS